MRLVIHGGSVDLATGLGEAPSGPVRLSDRERSLLRYLAERPGGDVSREELLTQVWGYSSRVVSRAVDTAVKRIREKLEHDPARPRHLLTVFGTGYRFVPLSEGDEALPTPASGRTLVLGERTVDLDRATVRGPGGEVALTTTEAAVLEALVAQQGRVVTRRDVRGVCAGPRGFDGVVMRLRGKLEPEPAAPRFLRTVRGGGYRLAPPEPVAPSVRTLVAVGPWQERAVWDDAGTAERIAGLVSRLDPSARAAGGEPTDGGRRFSFRDPRRALRWALSVAEEGPFGPLTVASTIHEIGHAIGLFHEQSRSDRDAFVNIHWGCILFPFAYNFYTYFPGSGQNVGPYDTSSIMHYDSMSFAAPNCGPTITRKDGSLVFAQRDALSGGDITGAQSLYQMWTPHRPVDYTGDGRADITVFRPASGTWLMVDSGTDQASNVQWGAPNDVPVPGDYDWDGIGDRAVWRPSSGEWYVVSSSNTGPGLGTQWGTAGDVPVPGDYDGDGRTEYAVWRPSDMTWHIKTVDGAGWTVLWGEPGDVPVPGDYDGDGADDVAVWRRSTGMWYIATSSGGAIERQWGAPSDVPVPGDYDGDGVDQIAVWRPGTGEWISLGEDLQSVSVRQWGTKSDTPVPADYDGDGTVDPAVYRSAEGRWYITTTYGPTSSRVWGVADDVPVP